VCATCAALARATHGGYLRLRYLEDTVQDPRVLHRVAAPLVDRAERAVSSAAAVEAIASSQGVFVQGAAAVPRALLDALVAWAPSLRNVEVSSPGKREGGPPRAIPP
jgi:hypothetical protein